MKASLKRRPIVDATKLSLDEWLNALDDATNFMVRTNFPTIEHRREFLTRIDDFDDNSVRRPECVNAIGVMETERANQGIIVTSGGFTKDARKIREGATSTASCRWERVD